MLTSKQFTILYDEYLESGQTIRSFCSNHQIRESKFYYWQTRLKNQLPAKKGFIPLVFDQPGQSRHLPLSAAVQNTLKTVSSTQPASCEITYPNGVSIKLNNLPDPELLRSLLLLMHQSDV